MNGTRIHRSERRRLIRFGLVLPLFVSRIVRSAGNESAATEVEALRALLARIERVLPQEVRDSLLPGATDKDLAKLRQIVLRGQPIPDDMRVLLGWHNGQHWNAPLSVQDNRRLLSAAEIVDQWSFFQHPKSDYLKPWQDSWIPLLTNDSGDLVVYETQGNRRGQLIAYWHDDSRRPVQHLSIRAWAEALLAEFDTAKASHAKPDASC